ncbi:hypothetical protein XENORESO_010321, partial [Xenotaenia resolanae]
SMPSLTSRPVGPSSASVAWSLHRDLGFPLDLVNLMLEERGVQVDHQALDRLISKNQKMLSEQQAGVRPRLLPDVLSLAELQRSGVPHTDDTLKYRYRLENGRYGTQLPAQVTRDDELTAVTPPLPRSSVPSLPSHSFGPGGQSHDQGYLIRGGLEDVLYSVEAVIRAGGYVVHQVTVPDLLKTGDQVQLHLNEAHRLSCMVKHTATHILNFALRKVLGPSVQQRGSHISADHLRFDFSVKGSLSSSQLQQVETCVNEIISANLVVHTSEVPLQKARTIQGLRTVDEIYPDPVRVVSFEVPVSELLDGGSVRETSVELCCGTKTCSTDQLPFTTGDENWCEDHESQVFKEQVLNSTGVRVLSLIHRCVSAQTPAADQHH